jgi:hypothetical protein
MTLSARSIRFDPHSPAVHAATAVLFLTGNALGYLFLGGLDFVQGWGGGFAAVIATLWLVWKSQGYWAWMIVNAGLWTALFFHEQLPLLAWLQVAFLVFSIYGMAQWAVVRLRIGWSPNVPSDVVGGVLGVLVLGYAFYAYRNMPGHTTWWWLELGSVVTAIAAIWMDAFRYKVNWVAWTLSNCLSAPLFVHGRLWGPFWTIFLYQALNVIGSARWAREERELRAQELDVRPEPLLDAGMATS